jgi:D-methionine transport system ATP-binding protein
MIRLTNLTKKFMSKDGDITAVDQINLDIKAGEIFGIIGYSGAGKSTLLRMLNMLELPSEGSVIIDNQNLTLIKGRELRKARQKIGMVFQHFNLLWSKTVTENIMLPLEIAGVEKGKMQSRANELIHLVGLKGKENMYPAQLSGGQKQRVGIARALANDPTVLLCDEATSALDPDTTDSILNLLVNINRKLNITIVLITHEMHVIQKICDRVAVMENGTVIEQGNVSALVRFPKQNVTKQFLQQLHSSPIPELPELKKELHIDRLREVLPLLNKLSIEVRLKSIKQDNVLISFNGSNEDLEVIEKALEGSCEQC